MIKLLPLPSSTTPSLLHLTSLPHSLPQLLSKFSTLPLFTQPLLLTHNNPLFSHPTMTLPLYEDSPFTPLVFTSGWLDSSLPEQWPLGLATGP